MVVLFRIGDTLLLGAHDVLNCLESEGCVEVKIINVWIHENYTDILDNDIALAK